jgi:hypothetical protein
LVFNHQTCPDGFFLENAGGGQKVAQVWVRQLGQKPKLSDAAFIRNLSRLSLLVLVKDLPSVGHREIAEVLRTSELPENILTMDDVTFYHIHSGIENIPVKPETVAEVYYSCTTKELVGEGISPIKGYRSTSVQDRLGSSARFVLLRPDFFVHSVALDVKGLFKNLQRVREYFT